MAKMKNAFLFYHDWEEDIKFQTPDECQRFILNLIRYDKGQEPYLPTKAEQMHWMQIRRVLDINKKKYDKRCETSSENGKKGGAPKGNNNAKKTT